MSSSDRDRDPDRDPGLGRLTRDELYRIAREQDLPGRSTMTVEELREALAPDHGVRVAGAAPDPVGSRTSAFRELAEARAAGQVRMLPRMQQGNDRRLHVRQTLREDHWHRIASRDTEAEEKFAKLAGSLFSFFRGTSLLFYRDMAGEDPWMPTVLTLGDVHPENFGVMPSADDVPIFGVNDFDEAYYAPFTWDLKRGTVGFILGAEVEGGKGPKGRRRIAEAFVRGYLDAIAGFAADGGEDDRQLRQDNAPPLIADLIRGAQRPRSSWLAKKFLDENRTGFRPSDRHVPITSRIPEFQEALTRYVERAGIDVPARAGSMRVKDVCERKGSGTASLGLARYFVLVEGPLADGTDDLLLEMKQARRSSLAGLVPPSEYAVDGAGDRIAHAHAVQLVRGDRFYGGLEFEGRSFMVRERPPYRDSVDVEELSGRQWRAYAAICGQSLAHAHALSDEIGRLDHDIEPAILTAVGPQDLFVDDLLRFAEEAAERVRQDHEFFKADHALGAFGTVDIVFR